MESTKSTDFSNNPPQKYLGGKLFIVFLAFLGAFIPLSTDAYLPALPSMVESLNTNAAMVNLTLVFFFVFYSIGILFWGPLSDKYGRKPILLSGLGIYTIASFLCIFSNNIYLLILYRIFQAVGCGAATAVSTAVVKDTYSGQKRGRIIAIVQTLSTTSPIISPVIGAFILTVVSWRGVFVVFTVIGVISLIGAVFLQETNHQRAEHGVFVAIGRLGVVARNKSFMHLLLIFGLSNIAFLAFITGSSYIYIDGFGVSEKVFSYYFAANAIFLLLGPIMYLKFIRVFNYGQIITSAYIVFALSGLLVITVGHISPMIFCLCLIPAALFGNMMGPARMNLMIEQVHSDIGSASSLIGSIFNGYGAIGMLIISIESIDRITLLGAMYLVLGVACLIMWLVIKKKPYIRHIT